MKDDRMTGNDAEEGIRSKGQTRGDEKQIFLSLGEHEITMMRMELLLVIIIIK